MTIKPFDTKGLHEIKEPWQIRIHLLKFVPSSLPTMNTGYLTLAASLALASNLCAQNPEEVTRLLSQLQSENIDTRRDAMEGLQTSLDPRIPNACLPLFQMEGDSIRRLAARAIGSRWHQIPKERIPAFTLALKRQLKSEHDGLVNMARRGIALLNRDYSDAMLSRSKSKRWVVYERYGLPCLIDTHSMSEELLGFPSEGKMSCAWGNSELSPTAKWHPKKDMVALEIIEGRKFSTLWLWVHGIGLRKITFIEQAKALGDEENDIEGAAGFFTEMIDWVGDDLDYKVNYAVKKGGDLIDYEAKLRLNSGSGKLSLISKSALQ